MTLPAAVTLPWHYSFSTDEVIEEVGRADDSAHPYFFLNSGGRFTATGGRGYTMQGNNRSGKWHDAYDANNPVDTDHGHFCQNLFRLYTRQKFTDVSCGVYFQIKAENFSASPNRNASNGLLVYTRATHDGQTMYYGGVRVDGTLIIKKKKAGVYTTLKQAPLFPGTFSRESNRNLLPRLKWIGVKLETKNLEGGAVSLTLYRDMGWSGVWEKIAEVVDAQGLTEPGYLGLRTDFMDVCMDGFRVTA